MSIFSRIREKPHCSICSKKMGLIGGHEYKDGYCCADCLSKCSPYYKYSKAESICDIRAHLVKREENLKKLSLFKPDKIIEIDNKYLLFDNSIQGFIFADDRVEFKANNPDILYYNQIKDFNSSDSYYYYEVFNNVTHGEKIKVVSYFPPKYRHHYQINYIIILSGFYTSEIKFDIGSVSIETSGFIQGIQSNKFKLNKQYKRIKKSCKRLNEYLETVTGIKK